MPNVQPAVSTELGFSAEQATINSRQMMQQGAELQKVGREGVAIELQALNEANQIRVDDSLNKLKESSLRLRYDPQTGFENVKGIDALERASGQSLMDEYGTTLQKQASEIENSLSNDAQKQAFRTHANGLITSFRGEAEQHEGREFQTYALSVREGTIKNRMSEIGLNYNNPEVVEQAVNSIRAATYDQGRLLGKSAEWSEAQALEATSKAHAVAIQTALQRNDPTFADAYLQKHAKDMQPDDILAVNGTLTTALNGQIGLTVANVVIQEMSPRINTSDSDRAFNIAMGTESNHRQFDKDGQPLTSSAGAIGIAQVMPDTAKEVAAKAGMAWDEAKYKTDATYNAKLGKFYFDEQLKEFNGNLAMAYAAYNAGPGRLKDGIAAAQAKGTPEAWLTEMPKETQDYVSKNMTAFGAGSGQYTKPTLLDVQNAIREKIGPDQPGRLKIALDEGERQFKAIEAATKQRNEEAVATAMRGVMENGGRFTDLPASTRAAVPPEEVTKVMDFAKRVSSGDDTTNLWLYNQLATQPDKLKSMSDNEFFALRAELSTSDFKHFSDERGKLLTGTAPNSPGDLNNEALNRTLNDRLNSMGIDPTPEDASSEAERVGAIRRFVTQSVATEQLNRGKKMNDVEVSSFIDTLFAQQGVHSGMLWDSKGPLLTTTIGQIPGSTKDALKAAFKRNGVDDPSDADLLNAYWRQTSMLRQKKVKSSDG